MKYYMALFKKFEMETKLCADPNNVSSFYELKVIKLSLSFIKKFFL